MSYLRHAEQKQYQQQASNHDINKRHVRNEPAQVACVFLNSAVRISLVFVENEGTYIPPPHLEAPYTRRFSPLVCMHTLYTPPAARLMKHASPHIKPERDTGPDLDIISER